MPPRKSPGSSNCIASLAPDRSTPSDEPWRILMPNAPEHHPWSGLAGPSVHGHNAAQLQDSKIFAFNDQAMEHPPLYPVVSAAKSTTQPIRHFHHLRLRSP